MADVATPPPAEIGHENTALSRIDRIVGPAREVGGITESPDAPNGGRSSGKIARDESVDGLAPQAAHRRRFHRRKKARTKAGFFVRPRRAPDFYANE
ncbi:hypothetical protein [Burkholderia ubonensis]|uniref:hypothetical protein n=1 Tax=Burkholderia ubonensis TaxID=101571 RepID=UPI002AB28BE9|nr:hypothetical protein [Burkholderia ubonensis]